MKPIIDQSLLDSLPIGGPIFDFNFANNWTENTGMFHATFTMKDDRKETALITILNERANRITNILN